MNSVIVIICAYLLGAALEGWYIQEFYFKRTLGEATSSFTLFNIICYLLLLLVLFIAIIKEKHQGLKLIQIGMVLFFITYSYQSAINRVEYFKTHKIRFYRYTGE